MTDKQLKNLKPFGSRTESEQREITKKGGVKSGESRRKKKTLKEELLIMLETKQTNGKTVRENWAVALGQKILKGDVHASIFVRDTVGEKPKEQVEIASEGVTGIKIQFVDKSQKTSREESDPKIVGEYTKTNQEREENGTRK